MIAVSISQHTIDSKTPRDSRLNLYIKTVPTKHSGRDPETKPVIIMCSLYQGELVLYSFATLLTDHKSIDRVAAAVVFN